MRFGLALCLHLLPLRLVITFRLFAPKDLLLEVFACSSLGALAPEVALQSSMGAGGNGPWYHGPMGPKLIKCDETLVEFNKSWAVY